MLELDELFGAFLERGYDEMDDQERDLFERFLECKDQDLLDWLLLQGEPTDGTFKPLIERIRRASLP